MRINGLLTRWNDERGFGFIANAQSGLDVFVHISSFPNDGQRPRIGERLSFEVENDQNGRARAIKLVCLDRQIRHATRQQHQRETQGILTRVVQLTVVVAVVIYGYVEYSRRSAPAPEVVAQPIAPLVQQSASVNFVCDTRTHCTQMTSCAEATFFLKNCPSVKMDGDNDGIPCEIQWCK